MTVETSGPNTAELTTLDSIAGVKKTSDHRRMAMLPRYFGIKTMIRCEQLIYNVTRQYCTEYGGGMWMFYELPNKGFVMTPKIVSKSADGLFQASWPDNWSDERVSAEALGIVACLWSYSNMAMYCHHNGLESEAERYSELYHVLRDVAIQHNEARAIFRLID